MENNNLPIKCEKDDKLGFGKLSSEIANGIVNSKNKNTFTIAIEGKWGSGKTSLVNLIEEKIKDKVILVHFNPWAIVDFEQLTRYFFSELIKEISHDNFNAKFKEDILQDIKKLMAFIIPDSVNIGVAKYNIKKRFFPEDQKSLYSLKKNINKYLRKMDKKIVIIVDDIDRLMDKETETLFRLIKGIADFDNIIYILLYDKEVVANSLKEFKNEKGEEYLEKIVQYVISVPKPFEYKIQDILSDEVKRIRKQIGDKCIFHEDRWVAIQNELQNHLRNLRDVYRLIDMVEFEYPIVCENVNFIDFFIISLIKMKNNELYTHIQYNSFFYCITNQKMLDSYNDKTYIMDDFKKNTSFGKYEGLLSIIFPVFQHAGVLFEKPYKNRYIGSEEYFNYYFAFDVSEYDVSLTDYSEIKELMLCDNNEEELRNKIVQLENDNKAYKFIGMFADIDLDGLDLAKEGLYNLILKILRLSAYIRECEVIKQMWRTRLDYLFHKYINFAFKLAKTKNSSEEIIKDIVANKEILLVYRIWFLEICLNSKYELKGIIEYEKLLKFNADIKAELEPLSLKDILLSEYSAIILKQLKKYGVHDNISKVLNENIFKSQQDFFEILALFECYNRNEQGFDIDESLMDFNIKGVDVHEYIQKLENLSSEEQKLIEIFNKSHSR
jgi:uridine kinase